MCFRLSFFSYIIQFVSHLVQFASLHRRLALESSWGSLLQSLPAGAQGHPQFIMINTDWSVAASAQTFYRDLFSTANLHVAGSVLHLKKHGFVLIKWERLSFSSLVCSLPNRLCLGPQTTKTYVITEEADSPAPRRWNVYLPISTKPFPPAPHPLVGVVPWVWNAAWQSPLHFLVCVVNSGTYNIGPFYADNLMENELLHMETTLRRTSSFQLASYFVY